MRKITSEWQTLNISCYPWDKTGYKPETTVKLRHDNRSLYLHFEVTGEEYIRAVCHNLQDEVYEDSCVEFFCSFDISSEKYINI